MVGVPRTKRFRIDWLRIPRYWLEMHSHPGLRSIHKPCSKTIERNVIFILTCHKSSVKFEHII